MRQSMKGNKAEEIQFMGKQRLLQTCTKRKRHEEEISPSYLINEKVLDVVL